VAKITAHDVYRIGRNGKACKSMRAARKVLEIDETVAEAHAALGLVCLFYDWDWMAAEREFTRAIELNSG
jgi:hypothetical protein